MGALYTGWVVARLPASARRKGKAPERPVGETKRIADAQECTSGISCSEATFRNTFSPTLSQARHEVRSRLHPAACRRTTGSPTEFAEHPAADNALSAGGRLRPSRAAGRQHGQGGGSTARSLPSSTRTATPSPCSASADAARAPRRRPWRRAGDRPHRLGVEVAGAAHQLGMGAHGGALARQPLGQPGVHGGDHRAAAGRRRPRRSRRCTVAICRAVTPAARATTAERRLAGRGGSGQR